MIKIGREEPVASMDASGKIIWARHNEIQTVNVKSLGTEYEDVRSDHLIPDVMLCKLLCRAQVCAQVSGTCVQVPLI